MEKWNYKIWRSFLNGKQEWLLADCSEDFKIIGLIRKRRNKIVHGEQKDFEINKKDIEDVKNMILNIVNSHKSPNA